MDQTNLIPQMKTGVVAVEAVAVEVEVAEECHHQDLEKQDMERLSLHTWTANCMARGLTSLQGTNERPENLSPSGTSTGASI